MASLAIPSSISRDLRTPSPHPSPSSRSRCSVDSTSPAPLYLPQSDGHISKICGSVIEPEQQRQRWSCHSCGMLFPRDATIYMAPRRPENSKVSPTDEHYCRSCYTARFNLGQCVACHEPVLGSTKEDGTYVRAGSDGRLWHGRCWVCVGCGISSSKSTEISLGLDGRPCCPDCFDRPPARRTDVRPASPIKRNSPPMAILSGNATRQGMGAAIAELSRKFGQPKADTTRPRAEGQASERASPSRLARGNSISHGIRPLTAQFSGQGFNLAAFCPTASPTMELTRSDSRSRPSSPVRRVPDQQPSLDVDPICARCGGGPFDGPKLEYADDGVSDTAAANDGVQSARMITIQGGQTCYHAACFRCAICHDTLESTSMTFVRLEDGQCAHATCAPAPKIHTNTDLATTLPLRISKHVPSSPDHATHQRQPRPSEQDKPMYNRPTSYLSQRDGLTIDPPLPNNRRFQSTSGAAPPTRTALLQEPRSSRSPLDATMRANANLAVSSARPKVKTVAHDALVDSMPAVPVTGRLGNLGGMPLCGGCNGSVSGLEGVPGPRGQSWHRKCLVCQASKPRRCGKALDSSAKVTSTGELRCRTCYDREFARHAVRI